MQADQVELNLFAHAHEGLHERRTDFASGSQRITL
jgi:hypothetical protein